MVYSRYMDYKNRHFLLGYKVIRWELALATLGTIVIALITKDYDCILSAVLGGGMVLITTIVYAFTAFRKGIVEYPGVVLSRHKHALLFRFIINIILFAIVVILYKQCNFAALLANYLAALSGYWLSLLF